LAKESTLNRKIDHLRKQARLQGFVSEIEINELADTESEKAEIVAVLTDESIDINPFVARKRQVKKRSSNPYFAHAGDHKYKDPTWTYLNQVGDVPLLSKDQMIHYARQMEFAKHKMLETAFCSSFVRDFLFRLDDELNNDLITCYDLLDLDEDQIDDEAYIEEMFQKYQENMVLLRSLSSQYDELEAALAKAQGNQRASLLEELRVLRDDMVESAFLPASFTIVLLLFLCWICRV